MRLWVFILLLYLTFAANFFASTDARRKLEGLKGARNSNTLNIKITKRQLETTFSSYGDVSNTKPCNSYSPYGSVAPNPIQENDLSYCNYPPFTPQPPPTSFPTPFPPSFTAPPTHLFPSPPSLGPSPTNPIHCPIPPGPIQGSPGLVSPSGPPSLGPSPTNPIPNPSPGPFQGSSGLVNPPELEPGVPDPPHYETSPPNFKPSPPFSYIPSPSYGTILPPTIYPAPMAPPNHGSNSPLWCVAKPSVPDPIIQAALDYACDSGADCEAIRPSGPCYNPNTLLAHASYAFNSYWQNTKRAKGTCDFGGTAILVTVDPSFYECHFILQ